jgi:hypothetical protein
MKKLFTLLTLALLSIGTAWASTVDDLTSITAPVTITMDGINGTSGLTDGTLYFDGKLLSLGGNGYSASKGSTVYNETTYQNVYQIKNSRQIALKIGFNASITVVGQKNSSRSWRIGTTSAGNQIADGGNNEDHATGAIDGSSTAKTVYINASSDLYLGAIIITENTSPTIGAPSTATIKATKSGIEAKEDIAVSGANLTGSTLTATLSPAVEGLSVTLASNTITAGGISTTATLHYTQTVNASGSTTLTLSDGTTSRDVTVNYKSVVIPTELKALTSATTFDLSKVGTTGLDVVTPDYYVVLADAGSEVDFADQLAVKGVGTLNVTWRSDAVQAGYFMFKTAVPGTVTVKFTDTGSGDGRPNRYANVNGIRSDVYTTSSSTTVKCSEIAVSAGDVIVKGEQYNSGDDNYTDNQIRVFEIVFTPLAAGNDVVEVGQYEWATRVAANDLDFTGSDVKAYIVTGHTGNAITLTQVNKVAAGTPVLLNAAKGSYVIPASFAGDADATTGNLLVAGAAISVEAGKTKYVLANDGGTATFMKVVSDVTVPATKAYLEFNEEISAPALSLNFEDVTGIADVRSKMEDVRGDFFDLQGRKVAQPTKGLYIVNGKKVVIK